MSETYISQMQSLIAANVKLSMAHSFEEIVSIIRKEARFLTGADGATFILRDGPNCHYVDEDAIGPLWKGNKFPMEACVSGWVMLNRQSVVIEDIYQDNRVPVDAYRPTFVKSMAMVPIRQENPIGAIGNYWSKNYRATDEQIQLLQSLADSVSIAMQKARLIQDLEKSLDETRIARDELQRQLQMRDEFISIAAHELRTPATPLSIQIQFLDRLISKGEFTDHPRASELQKFADVTRRQMHDFKKLIDNLLDVSRIRLGKFDFQFEDQVDLGETVSRIVEQFTSWSRTPIQVQIHNRTEGVWDRVKIEQVVRNLISNALKYGMENPVKIDVYQQDLKAVFKVTDQGIGLKPEDLHRIFDRFERANSIRNFGGVGLGLYVARQIVDGHRGKIQVESEFGKGSIFTVELPVHFES